MRIRIIGLLLALAFSGQAQQLKLDTLQQVLSMQPEVEINLGAGLLRLLSSATEDEADISGILKSLNSISVRVYNIEAQADISGLKSWIQDEVTTLTGNGLQQLASIRDDDSMVHIMANMLEDKMAGLVVMALDDEDQFVLINIQGEVMLKDLGSLMDHFDVDVEALGLNK